MTSYIGRGIDSIDNISTLDNLSFNGSDATFNLTQNSVAFVPVSADALQIQIDGVIQSGNYTVSGSTVTFDFTPSGSSVCNGIRHFGVGLLTTVSDGAVTTAKLGADSVNGSKIADNSISDEHLDITAITGQTEKTSLADADKFLISDSAASGALKYVQKSNLPSGTHVKLLGGTASSSVNHDFQNFMDATKYNVYLVNLHQITNGSGGNQRIDLNFIANTTVLNGSHYWGSVLGYRSGDLQAEDAYESIATGKLGQKLIMNDGNRGNNRFYINVDTSRDFGVNVFGANWGYNSTWGDWMFTNYSFGYNSTDTVTGIRLFDSGANATVFDYEIYGILK